MPGPLDPALELPPDEYVKRLEEFERVLVEVKESLYEGSWDQVLADLRARLEGKPYLFKLGERIRRDIAAIERMRAYEARHGVQLAQWVGRT